MKLVNKKGEENIYNEKKKKILQQKSCHRNLDHLP